MKKKNIGIMTWHYYPNFGSALQSFALQSVIAELGYDTKIINYRNLKYGKQNRVKDVCRYVLDIIFRKTGFLVDKFCYPFIRFHYQFLKQTKLIQDESKLPKVCKMFDAVVCGSDQIWAPNVFNSVYMLDFVPNTIKKVSYAASIGLNDIPDELVNSYKKLLSNFCMISVRERLGAEIIKEKCGITASVVLDPTLLMDANKWSRLENAPKNLGDERYVFCYFLKHDHNYAESVRRFAKKHGYRILGYTINHDDCSWMDKKIEKIGPCEFLWLIHNAAVVITDSYHGTIFSLLYHKDFITLERFESADVICQNSRIYQLKDYFGLDNQIVKVDASSEFVINKVNYDIFENQLTQLRKASVEYLMSALEE